MSFNNQMSVSRFLQAPLKHIISAPDPKLKLTEKDKCKQKSQECTITQQTMQHTSLHLNNSIKNLPKRHHNYGNHKYTL